MRTAKRTVYILETGCYDQKGVAGVFDTPERAMAAGKGEWQHTVWTHFPNWPSTKKVRHWESWDNDLDWDEAATVRAIELTETGAERPADTVVVQTLNKRGSWDYVPITSDEASLMMAEGEGWRHEQLSC